MSTARRASRRTTAVALALATGAASTCVLGAVSRTALADTPPLTGAPATDADAREGAVAAIVLGADGRPTFVEVVAPTVEQAVQRASRLPGSDGVAVDTPMTTQAVRDPYRSLQWSLDTLRVDSLPALPGGAPQLVAVVDTGVRATHEDFAVGQVRCDLGADFTGEGLGPCTDPKGHGTHVAGIVGAVTGNGRGVASIAPGTAILPVRVLDSAGSGGSIAVARGIVHAADRGATVINLSLGGPGADSGLDAAVTYATGRGSLVVVSAGNNRQQGNQVNYPAASPGALSVASIDQGGRSSAFSYSGASVDIAAPGGRIASLGGSRNDAYGEASGTSMAAPAVSAVASLYLAANPSASPEQVTAALLSTARDLEVAGRDDNTGAGMVDPYVLLRAAGTATGGGTSQPTQPSQPGSTTPAPVTPAPVVTRAPAPTPPVTKAPVPRARVVTPRVARKQAIPLVLADYRPASSVSVLEVFPVTQRVRVTVNGRTVTRTQTTSRTVLLGSFRVAADGSVSARVLPVQGVRTARLAIRGFDRAGKVVQTTAAIRVG